LVFAGGLTGVQARLRTEGATVLAQRDIDEHFRSVFIAHRGAGLDPSRTWRARRRWPAAGTVDTEKMQEIFTTPQYADYHWVGSPELDERSGGAA
jgi:hypothetical protein